MSNGARPELEPLKGLFNLDKTLIDRGFLSGNGALTVGVSNQTDPAVVQRILDNAPLGADEVIIAKPQATANTTIKDIEFLTAAAPVTFTGTANAYAELAIFPDPASDDFTTALGPVAETKFSVAADPNRSLVVLLWGANESAAGSGSIAFASGAGNLQFSAQEKGELFFAVLQQADRTTPIDDALASVVRSWKLPAHVHTADDLAPRTHLIAEAGGSLSASIAATFGHQFNWLRRINDQTRGPILQGDVGLQLQLGLTAAFNLAVQGKFAVCVSRETTDSVIRVRIYKLRMHEFDFALGASVGATADVPLPASFDDLLEAALGVHVLQILQDLEDPNTIQNWINQFGPQYVQDLLKKFTGLDLDAAIQKMQSFIAAWQNLPHSAASLFAKLAQKEIPDFSQIQQLATLLANKDSDGLKAALASEINNLHTPFLSTPAARYMEGIAGQGALSLLDRIPDSVQQAAQATTEFLNGDKVAELLNQIQTELEKRLGLQAILADVQGDPATVLDKLLFSKLTDFLGKQPALQDLQQLQTRLKDLDAKASALYQKTVEALTKTYTAQLSATYQQTTTDTALIDASFDFTQQSPGAPVQRALEQLLAGKLDDFLMHPQPGVTLSSGTLTHQVVRHSQVDFTLPFLEVEHDTLNTVSTQFNAVDQQNGRLMAYQFNAQDQVSTKTSWWNGQNWRSTSLSLAGQMSALIPPGLPVRVFATTPLERDGLASGMSSLRMQVSNLALPQFTNLLEPFALQFLPDAFPDTNAFTKWTAAGHLLDIPGNTLVSLDVSIPPEAIRPWLSVTATDPNDQVYMNLSLRLQFWLKQYLCQYYFRDPASFDDERSASIVLMYAALQPSTAIQIPGKPFARGVYWNPMDSDEFNFAVSQARDSFGNRLRQAHDRLVAAGSKDAPKYDATQQFNARLNDALSDRGKFLLVSKLLLMESKVIHTACDGARDMANFHQQLQTSPKHALDALADFGHNLTEAFNSDLSQLFVQDTEALQRLSPLIFARASTALDPSLKVGESNSLLNVTVLKPGAATPSGFPDFQIDPADALVSLNASNLAQPPAAARAAG
jgi:methylphosphotriester-DNA--protein-cysteine methyltransferase